MAEADRETFSGALNYLMSTSSAHGLPNVQRSKSMLAKLVWTMLFFAGVCLLFIQSVEIFKTFLRYNYTVSLDVRFDRELHFPAVTVCNYNPVLRSKLVEASEEFRNIFDVSFKPQQPYNGGTANNQAAATLTGHQTEGGHTVGPNGVSTVQQSGQHELTDGPTTVVSETQSSGRGSMDANTTPGGLIATSVQQTVSQAVTDGTATTSGPVTNTTVSNVSTATIQSVTTQGIVGWEDRERGDFFEKRDESYILEQTLITELANVTEEERQHMGHSLSTMLLDCKWKGYPCSPSNFTSFFHYKYGNCYTFNHFTKRDLFTNRPGPLYGLSMRLFVEQDEYMQEMTESAGFRLVVHDRHTMPFPEDDGIAISPGFQTAIAARIVSIERLGVPYSNCTAVNAQDRNIFRDVYNVSYSLKTCERSCYQLEVIKRCKCFDPQYPSSPDSSVYPCEIDDEKAEACLNSLEDMYKKGTLGCSCHQACKETTYITSVSSAVWPADQYEEKLFRDIINRNEEVQTNLQKSSPGDWVKKNVAKVDVFFQEFNYEYIRQSPAYARENLLSDIGGQLGLWLGLSVLTVFEFVENCGVFLSVLFHKVVRRKKTTVTPVKSVKIFPVDDRGVSLEHL